MSDNGNDAILRLIAIIEKPVEENRDLHSQLTLQQQRGRRRRMSLRIRSRATQKAMTMPIDDIIVEIVNDIALICLLLAIDEARVELKGGK